MLLPRSVVLAIFAGPLFVAPSFGGQAVAGPHVEVVRFWSFGDVTRIAIETAGDYHFTSDSVDNPARVFFDLNGLKPPSTVHHGMQTIPVGDKLVKQIRVAEVIPGTTRIVLDVLAPVDFVSSQLVNPDRLIIEIRPKDVPPLVAQNIRHSTSPGAQRVNLSSSSRRSRSRDLPATRHPPRRGQHREAGHPGRRPACGFSCQAEQSAHPDSHDRSQYTGDVGRFF